MTANGIHGGDNHLTAIFGGGFCVGGDAGQLPDELLDAVNTGSKKRRGTAWYSIGRYVYVPLAIILCCVALFMKVAF